MNRIQIGDSAALVSLGGTFSDRQITGVMERFPNARASTVLTTTWPGGYTDCA